MTVINSNYLLPKIPFLTLIIYPGYDESHNKRKLPKTMGLWLNVQHDRHFKAVLFCMSHDVSMKKWEGCYRGLNSGQRHSSLILSSS